MYSLFDGVSFLFSDVKPIATKYLRANATSRGTRLVLLREFDIQAAPLGGAHLIEPITQPALAITSRMNGTLFLLRSLDLLPHAGEVSRRYPATAQPLELRGRSCHLVDG
jgi:hypothetical protein